MSLLAVSVANIPSTRCAMPTVSRNSRRRKPWQAHLQRKIHSPECSCYHGRTLMHAASTSAIKFKVSMTSYRGKLVRVCQGSNLYFHRAQPLRLRCFTKEHRDSLEDWFGHRREFQATEDTVQREESVVQTSLAQTQMRVSSIKTYHKHRLLHSSSNNFSGALAAKEHQAMALSRT